MNFIGVDADSKHLVKERGLQERGPGKGSARKGSVTMDINSHLSPTPYTPELCASTKKPTSRSALKKYLINLIKRSNHCLNARIHAALQTSGLVFMLKSTFGIAVYN